VLAYKQGIVFLEINHSLEDTSKLFQNEDNLNFLFDVLDRIVELQKKKPTFWDDMFYTSKNDFTIGKTRIFFQNSNINLLEKCLFNYDKYSKGFAYPEQLLFYACLIHFVKKTKGFSKATRIVRNLVSNSENELRDITIGLSFSEIEEFVQSFNFEQLDHFKRDQIKEEEEKFNYINQNNAIAEQIYELEDSDILRGSISIFDLNAKIENRIKSFLNIFDEDIVNSEFINRSNLLLCFGDYSQEDGVLKNLLASAKGVWRKFITTPAFNKSHLTSKTKKVLIECLDYFEMNQSVSFEQKIEETCNQYENSPKDWIYYFLKYPSFRNSCNKGYYYWNDTNTYPLFKMKEKQFNGYHWDPFLIEIKEQANSAKLILDIGSEMQMILGNELLKIKSHPKGFFVESKNDSNSPNLIYNKLIDDKAITSEGLLEIIQNADNIDMEDRVVRGFTFIKNII